ncbi:MAG TPA: condensation domain-containing protein, partial [Chitinophagaceae bacterium]|nr:condensation domain-containing protein [Chitinophagaceae bacterium]
MMGKLQERLSIKELLWAVDQEVLKEEELCLSPEFFFALKEEYPSIDHIDIRWKAADYINELSQYRYTVTLYVGAGREMVRPAWYSFEDKSKVRSAITAGASLIGIKDVPNPRLWKERVIEENIDRLNTIEELSALISKEESSNEILQLMSLAGSKGYNCHLLTDEDPMRMNLVFTQGINGLIEQAYSDEGITLKADHSNIPLFTDISALIAKDIRQALHASLPEYMIPAELVSLVQLPLTGNGKTDRRFLMEREDSQRGNEMNYVAPRTREEKTIAQVWEALLGSERIGIHDNFFDIGGHSLLATRVVSAIRRRLEVELGIRDLFIHPTIAALAMHLQQLNKGLMLPAITRQPRPERIPLSFAQERLWFIHQLEGSVQYHVPAALRFRGRLDAAGLDHALQTITNRHESLRTVIVQDEKALYQKILEKDNWKLQLIDGREYRDNEDKLALRVQELVTLPFDLGKDYMFRAWLIGIDTEDHVLVVVMHHIASDGWSLSIIVRELTELYNSYVDGREPSLAELPIQYADYALWQRAYLEGEVLEKKLSYWQQKLSGVTPLQLPADHVRPARESSKGSTIGFIIDEEMKAALHALCAQQGTTLYMTMLAAFKVLLHRYSGQEDICVGSPIAGRQQQETEGLIGFFINSLVLRSHLTGDMQFSELLQQVRSTTLEAYDHQEAPFEKVVEAVVKDRDMSRSPLFQVMFVLQNTPNAPELRLGEAELVEEGARHNTAKYDINISITEFATGLRVSMEYRTDLFERETMLRMAEHYTMLLRSVVASPEQKIGSLNMLNGAEQHQLLHGFNDAAAVEYPRELTIVDLIEKQVQLTPHATAVVYEGKQITYHELNNRSNQLSHYLRKKGVKKESFVAICLERSLEMITGLLGILKAGGAYVPIDPEYPQERISYMLEDTGAKVVLSSAVCADRIAVKGTHIIELDTHWPLISDEPTDLPAIELKPSHLAYVIYTSGSTGRPKGVLIEHRNVVRLFENERPLYEFRDTDVWTMFHSVCFDFSVWEMYGALFYGGRLVIVPSSTARDTEKFAELLVREGVTILNQTPSAFYVLQDHVTGRGIETNLR